MHDKDFRLVEFLKYDSGLGRDQNIEMGNTSSLAAQENIYIQGGVTLSCFAPVKYINGARPKTGDTEDNKPLNWEQKIQKRLQDEKDGIIMPRQVTYTKEGDKKSLEHQMTRKKYQALYSS